MGYLIMVSQQSFSVMIHILSDIAGIEKSEWPQKYHVYENVVQGFMAQHEKKVPNVAHIVPKDQLKGFLDTIGGYKKATYASLDVTEYASVKDHLKRSVALLERLTAEINTELSAQSFSVK